MVSRRTEAAKFGISTEGETNTETSVAFPSGSDINKHNKFALHQEFGLGFSKHVVYGTETVCRKRGFVTWLNALVVLIQGGLFLSAQFLILLVQW